MKKLILLSLPVLLLFSCRSANQSKSNDAEIYTVKTIAILPVQVNYTGTIPKKMTQVMLDSLAQVQGIQFQQALQRNVMRFNGNKKKIQGVSIQSIDKTNSLLQQQQLTVQNAFTKDPDELAKLLGVDAVVKMNVTSNRLMSDLASLGIGVLDNILFFGTNVNPGVTLGLNNKTADVLANCVLLKNGKTLWTANYDRPTDWNTSIYTVMDRVTTKMGRGFPF
jgi:hypothetical protein